MKQTRINSMLFIGIGGILLAAITIPMFLWAFTMQTLTATVGVIIAIIVVIIVGLSLLLHCHNMLFDDMLTYCLDCNNCFKESEIEKQIEYTFGKMYISYRCPHCRASMI